MVKNLRTPSTLSIFDTLYSTKHDLTETVGVVCRTTLFLYLFSFFSWLPCATFPLTRYSSPTACSRVAVASQLLASLGGRLQASARPLHSQLTHTHRPTHHRITTPPRTATITTGHASVAGGCSDCSLLPLCVAGFKCPRDVPLQLGLKGALMLEATSAGV